jgi:hypothetical protein
LEDALPREPLEIDPRHASLVEVGAAGDPAFAGDLDGAILVVAGFHESVLNPR